MKKKLLLLILICTIFDLFSQSQVFGLSELDLNILPVKSKQERTDIHFDYIGVLKDSANKLTIEDIRSSNSYEFTSLRKFEDVFEKKISYWLTFQIKNISENSGEWILEFRDIPCLEIYISDENDNTHYHRTGTLIADSEKQMKTVMREAVLFTLKSNEEKTFHVKFHYLFNTQILNPISISDTKSYIKQTTIENLIQGIFQGLLWMMLLYNLFLYISTRQKTYLYYICYVFSFSMLMLYAQQYLSNFIFPEDPTISSYFGIFIFVGFIFYFLLLREFIDSRNEHPQLDKSLRIVFLFDLVVTVIVFIFQFVSIESFGLVGMEYSSLNVLALLVYVGIIFKIGNKVSKIFALGTSFLVLCLSVALIGTYLDGDTDILMIIFQAGIVGEIFIFSVGLSYKYKIIEQQKQTAQGDLIIQFKENQQLQTKVNRELEQEVSKRTEEISLQKEELNTTLDYLKQTQSQLIQTEKMAGIGQLTAGIAHEINNPINYVTAGSIALKKDIKDHHIILDLYAEITPSNVEEKLAEISQLKEDIDYVEIATEIENLLNNIKIGGEKVAEIVRLLRTFSRLDERDLKIVNLQENIDATLTILRSRIGTQIEIEKLFEKNIEVECFPGELNQVFLNMLNNAIEATKAGGKITVKTKKVSDTCRISISDTGKGIPAEIQNRIFEPFFTTKDIGKGKGLGLSTAHHIVKEHHGKIEVESKTNKGTTFTIVIPVFHPKSKNS